MAQLVFMRFGEEGLGFWNGIFVARCALIGCDRVVFVCLHRLKNGLVAHEIGKCYFARRQHLLHVAFYWCINPELPCHFVENLDMLQVVLLELRDLRAERLVIETLDAAVIRGDGVMLEIKKKLTIKLFLLLVMVP